MAYTNDEVMQLYSHLDALDIGAKYILERENFALKNIVEIIEFDKTINRLLKHDTFYTEENFEDAWLSMESRFKGSKNLTLLQKVIDRFLFESQNYYVSQWLAYLDEIKLEEFEDYQKTVTVSTIHKSKGMEFDNVIVLINQNPTTDEDKRLYYVGMTRAKNELSIIRHGANSLNRDSRANYIFDDSEYPQNDKLVILIMGLEDIQLGFHNSNPNEILAGESMGFEMRGKAKTFCLVYNNKVVGFELKQDFGLLFNPIF